MKICLDCGKEIHEGKFCKNCGAYIKHTENIIENTNPLPPTTQSADKTTICFNCQNKITEDFKYCPECGQNLTKINNTSIVKYSNDKKNILLAIILSIILPGMGQIYLKLDNKGAIFLITYIISIFLIILLIGIILSPIIWIWALIDTIISAKAINRGETIKDKIL